MRMSITVVVAMVLLIMMVSGVVLVASGGLDSGEEEINETGGFFTDCIWGSLSNGDESECNLFENTENTGES